jgi:hypothetical protein
MPMKSNLTNIVLISFIFLGLFFWTEAQSDTTKPLNAKPGFYFKMKIVEKGRSLVKTFECNDCHTAGYLQSKGNVPEDQWLTGESFGWSGPLGTTYGANLRLLIDSLTEDEWVEMSKNLARRPPMPHVILNAMIDEDLQAIYQFVRYLGPSGKPAPAYVPPGQEPIKPPAIMPEPPK